MVQKHLTAAIGNLAKREVPLSKIGALKYGELKSQSKSEQRNKQIIAIKEIGFHNPYL